MIRAAVLTAAAVLLAGSAPGGALREINCVSATAGVCAQGGGLDAPAHLVVSADGRNVYVAGQTGGIAVFSRAKAGALTEVQCFSPGAADGCTAADGLKPSGLAATPDGREVYAATGDAIWVFTRAPTTGQLTAGTPIPAGVSSLTVSPDGRNVYATGRIENGTVTPTIVLLIFARNRSTRSLAQIGCLANAAGIASCTHVRALGLGLASSRDGRSLYASSQRTIAVFARNTKTGALRQPAGAGGCISMDVPGCAAGRNMYAVDHVAVSPDGKNVYAAVRVSSSFNTYSRNQKTGALKQLPGRSGCYGPAKDGCASGFDTDGAPGLAISPDGKYVYGAVSGQFFPVVKATLLTLLRDRKTGALSGGSCVSGGDPHCARVNALGGVLDVAVSPDGKNVYTAALADKAVAAFGRGK